MKDHLPNFKNKLVSLSIESDGGCLPLITPHWEKQGGRLFLVGTVPNGGSTRDWCKSKVSAIAWDSVTDYLVFDSVADYRHSLKRYESRKRSR